MMTFSTKNNSVFTFVLASFVLLSCVRSTVSNEKTRFTHVDSLTETYLNLQDTLLHSWNVLAKDEQEKLGIVMGNIPSGLGAQIREDMSVRVTQLILRNVNQVIATPF